MVVSCMIKSFGLLAVGLVFLFLGLPSAFALPVVLSTSAPEEQVVLFDHLPVPSFTVLPTPSFTTAVLVDSSSPPLLDPTVRTSSVANHSRGSDSTLTVTEMKLVMSGGRNFDPVSKKWGYRDAMKGERRNKFLLSWEAHRKRSGVNQLIPSNEAFSK